MSHDSKAKSLKTFKTSSEGKKEYLNINSKVLMAHFIDMFDTILWESFLPSKKIELCKLEPFQ